jgi:type II secretory pathway pseudopilin PulG
VRRDHEHGFSLVETMMAVSLLAFGVSALAQVAMVAVRASMASERLSVAQQAARERLEQLRGLTWTSDGTLPISDWTTDLTRTPSVASGGAGLGVSPGSALTSNTAGYCDFLDPSGRWLAAGTRAPAGAAWIRRWSITPLNEDDVLVMEVVVVPADRANEGGSLRGVPGGAWLVTMRHRGAR